MSKRGGKPVRGPNVVSEATRRFARTRSHFLSELSERDGLTVAITIRLSIHFMREFEVSDFRVSR